MDLSHLFDFIMPVLKQVPILRAILGFAIVFFLPGFTWTLVFFKQVNIIERAALSFGLSIAIVTLSIIVLNVLLKVRITGLNSLLTIIVVAIIPLLVYYLKRLLGSHSSGHSEDDV